MWNRIVTPLIDDKEGMDVGGEVTSANEENGGREWLSAAAMTVDGYVAVCFLLCFMACSVKNKGRVGIQGVSVRMFSTGLYGKLWENVAYKALKMKKWLQLCRNSELIMALTSASICSSLRTIPIIDDDVVRMCPSDLIECDNRGTKGVRFFQLVLREIVSH